jgi:hypothetical protein
MRATSMKKLSRMGLLAVAIFGIGAGVAVAGQKYTYPVYVNSSQNYAEGSMGSARNSTDTSQMIGCAAEGWTYNGTSYSAVFCNAMDSAGHSASCYTSSNPTLLATVGTITSDSYVYFAWDSTGACTVIEAETWSTFAPKQP